MKTAESHSLDRAMENVDGVAPDGSSVDGDEGVYSSVGSQIDVECLSSIATIRSAGVECVLDRMMSLVNNPF